MFQAKNSVRDSISFFSDASQLRRPTVAAISALQDAPPHLQVLGMASALTVLCEGLDFDPVEVITRIRNAKSNIDAPFATQWQAMVEYAKGELK